MLKNTVVVIPSLNPDEKLSATVMGMQEAGFEKIVIVNDGSDTQHLDNFPLPDDKITVLHHGINKGKGAALKTAFKYILENISDAKGVITVDGDGQHTDEDAVACVKALYENEGSVVLGCRNFSTPDVPKRSRIGNKFTIAVFKVLCGIKISDTQTGLRAIPIEALPLLLSVKGDRFEYETNMLLKLNACKIKLYEVPIKTVYIEDNASSHFRPVVDSFKIYKFILSYFLNSMISYIVDISLFYVLCLLLNDALGVWCAAVSTVAARAVSSFINYTLNRKRVFDTNSRKSFWRYYALVIPIMLLSASSVTLAVKLFASTPNLQTIVKVIVDALLFLLSYRIQRNWVFVEKMPKEKTRLTAKKVIGRIFLSLITAALMLLITVASACLMICYGPSESLKNMTVIMAMEASATKWIPRLFISDAEVDRILALSNKVDTETVDADSIQQNTNNTLENNAEEMQLIFLNKSKFKGYLLLVKNPERVKVGVSAEDFSTAKEGVGIFNIAEKYSCTAAINGGEFSDIGGMGNGATPMGITYSGGKLVWDDGLRRTFIGFDKNNRLVCKEGLTKEKAEALGIRDGVCFKNGNTLIEKVGDDVKIHRANASIGPAQRTAIGQTADGTVVLLVTDGRSTDSIGATRNDVIDIMLSYGAVTAGMLDGGSSAMMYYRDYVDKLNVDTSHYDDYQKQGMVNRYKAFTKPRSIPTYFIVE